MRGLPLKRLGWFVVAILGIGVAAWYWSSSAPKRHLAEAENYVRLGRGAEALAWLDVPEVSPATRDQALLLRARIALQADRPQDAVQPLDQIAPDGPWGIDAAFWKGRTLQAMHEPREAIAWFRRAWKARPADAEIPRWIAVAAYDLGDRRTALAALEAVTKIQPDDAKAWRTMGLIFKEKAEYEAALAAYDASLKIERTQPEVRFERAEALAGLGRFADAEAALESSRGGVGSADRAALLGRCQIGRGNLDAARRTLDAALTRAPDHPQLLGERASIDQSEGHFDESVRRLDRAVISDPYSAQWHYQRGLALRALNRPAEAEDDLARARSLQHDFARLSALDDEAALRPDDAEVRERLGDLCLRLGKPELAASWYRAALSCDPERISARRALHSLNARSGGRIRQGAISLSTQR
jgi:tetratricopeptide (TPR) repeat protein